MHGKYHDRVNEVINWFMEKEDGNKRKERLD